MATLVLDTAGAGAMAPPLRLRYLRESEARALFERLLGLSNDVGLLSEEYDTRAKRLVGNFPQAFSHVGLVNTAHNLSRAAKPAYQRAES